ncbi:uncharacterized protein LOC8073664 [Sorghum bicolor]|uniref:uncharacterized protein LOC8073664 n=1 Tax=Sorghum bicolor TaxID=4558 RepID=UPI000B42543F|nr:uncharacterized protein LOC8073664 [Sorghum bicolor]|eukprot:XP_021316309.1 uncharacterized protein LOC8073664 [Sorghum bicolor]
MNLVTRLALGGHHGSRRLFTRGGCGSLGLRRRSIHLVPSLVQPREPSDDDSPSATSAKDPSWVLLNPGGCRRVFREDDDSMADHNETLAESRTSTGQHHLRVSFRLTAPPAISFLCYDYAGTVPDDEKNHELAVIASHGDSILLRLRMTRRERRDGRGMPLTFDHFVYRAGTGTRPPSLTLLPELSFPRKYGRRRFLEGDTGVLRRGEDDLLVAQLDTGHHDDRPDLANLCVLRVGRSEWEHKCAVPIVHEDGVELMGTLSGPDMTIPVGDRFLCGVCFYVGVVVCDMAEEASPKLRHVRLPVYYDPSYYTNDLPPLTESKSMGAAGPSAVRFVAVEPRCCCGRHGRSSCPRSSFAFTVTTWTLTLTMDEPMAWVKDGVLDCEELWAMPGYEGLPRVHLQSPVVSLDNPDVVCFKVGGRHGGNQNAWMIEVDMRRKVLLAAVQWNSTGPWRARHLHIPAKV